MALCSRAARDDIAQTVRRITKIETALAPRFQDHFVAANALPHARDPFPELARIVTLPTVRFNAGSGGDDDGRSRRRRRKP